KSALRARPFSLSAPPPRPAAFAAMRIAMSVLLLIRAPLSSTATTRRRPVPACDFARAVHRAVFPNRDQSAIHSHDPSLVAIVTVRYFSLSSSRTNYRLANLSPSRTHDRKDSNV